MDTGSWIWIHWYGRCLWGSLFWQAWFSIKTNQLNLIHQSAKIRLEIKQHVEEETKLKAQAQAAQEKAEEEAEKLRKDAEAARQQAEEEAKRAAEAEAARKEAEEKAKELHKEALEKKSNEAAQIYLEEVVGERLVS